MRGAGEAICRPRRNVERLLYAAALRARECGLGRDPRRSGSGAASNVIMIPGRRDRAPVRLPTCKVRIEGAVAEEVLRGGCRRVACSREREQERPNRSPPRTRLYEALPPAQSAASNA